MEITASFVKKDFGPKPCLFTEVTEMLADIRPNEEHAREHIERSPVTTVTQIVPEMSEHEANTNAVHYATKAMNHVEGGWPKEVDYSEAEHTIRYRKKVEKDEEYIKAVVALGAVVEELVKENNALDIYQQYFQDEGAELVTEAPALHSRAVFKDPAAAPRAVQYLSWHPDGSRKVAGAYANMKFQAAPGLGAAQSSYVWDLANPTRPEAELAAPATSLTCLNYNLKEPALIGAGLYTGLFAVFDTRRGAAPAECTPIDRSHRDPIYDFSWLQSKTGTECMTVSTDGSVLWWDIRKLVEPTETLQLRERGSDALLGAVALEYSPAAGPTKFMVGTEQGSAIACNRKAKNPADRVGAAFTGHHGPVYGLARNAFFPKVFLSCGDWTVRLWNEDIKTPIVMSSYHSAYLTGGRWSPTRPAVFMATRTDGHLEAWDLLARQREPVLDVPVASCALRSLRLSSDTDQVAVGSEQGAITVLQASAGLCQLQPNEKQALALVIDRESGREKNLEKAQKEARVKAKKEAARGAEAGGARPAAEQAQELEELEQSFFAATRGP